jgi:hypothetical protein
MSFNPFAYLRTAARNAMLAGVSDAMNELAPNDGEKPLTLADIQVRLALPAPASAESEEKPVKSKRAA